MGHKDQVPIRWLIKGNKLDQGNVRKKYSEAQNLPVPVQTGEGVEF